MARIAVCYEIARGDAVYIGRTVRAERRWYEHKYLAAKGSNYPVHAAIRKYGADAFSFSVVACSRNETDINAVEVSLIAQARAAGKHVMNLAEGGNSCSGAKFSDETRARMSEAHLGVRPTAETISRLRAAKRKYWDGLQSAEHRRTLADHLRRVRQTEQSGEKNPSHKLSDEQVREIRHLRNTEKLPKPEIAKRFGIHPEHVGRIARGIARRTA